VCPVYGVPKSAFVRIGEKRPEKKAEMMKAYYMSKVLSEKVCQSRALGFSESLLKGLRYNESGVKSE